MNTDLRCKVADIKRRRKLYEISQLEISNVIGVSNGTFSRWEKCQFKNAQLSYVIEILEYLDKVENDKND